MFFIDTLCGTYDLTLTVLTDSDVDEIVLSYISEVLGDLGEGDEGSFDVDQFSEMVSAYVPEFSTIQWYITII